VSYKRRYHEKSESANYALRNIVVIIIIINVARSCGEDIVRVLSLEAIKLGSKITHIASFPRIQFMNFVANLTEFNSWC